MPFDVAQLPLYGVGETVNIAVTSTSTVLQGIIMGVVPSSRNPTTGQWSDVAYSVAPTADSKGDWRPHIYLQSEVTRTN